MKILFTLITLVFTLKCASSKPYKLSEATPKYAKYEGKTIDPLKDNPVNKPDTGIKKYDDFFIKAKKLIIKVQLAKKIAESKNSADIPDKTELVMDMVAELPSLAMDIKMITEDGKNLSASVKSDFMGPDILKLPGVLGELAVTTKELGEAGIAIPKLIVALSTSDDAEEGITEQNPNAIQLSSQSSKNIGLPVVSKSPVSQNFISNRNPPVFTGSKATELRLNRNRNSLQKFNEYLVQKKDQ